MLLFYKAFMFYYIYYAIIIKRKENILIDKNLSGYFSGLTDMASSCSKEIGLSYINTIVFKLNNYKESFSKYYKVPITSIDLIKSDITLNKLFEIWLGKDKNLIESLIYYIEHDVGTPKAIYKVKEDNNLIELLSGYNNGISGFYIVEDIYFVEYEKVIVCFILGNNE